MKYLCLAYGDEEKSKAMTPSQWDDLIQKCRLYDDELQKSGHLVSGMSLGWGATTLRLRNGKLSVTDGPFAATKEVVGGLVLIEARDLNEAIQVASLHPAARMGEELGWGIEVRQIEEHPPCKG
ncbi:MAG TPA: YciI family protein [Thermoanaerobaculia bacterium]|nr:YciI family protein [Thermoanaerobaculia bacterium]